MTTARPTLLEVATERRHAAVLALSGNPFAMSAETRAHESAIFNDIDLAAYVTRALEDSRSDLAARAVLAAMHLSVHGKQEPETASVGERIPDAIFTRLPHDRHAYARIVCAADRCYRHLGAIAGKSAAMQAVRHEVWAACFGDSLLHALHLERVIRDHDVLILGETGTGKESIAGALQAGTPGADAGEFAPRAAINAAAIPETLIESELFGHVKGAFTGASETRRGRIRKADGGTFFLDEVGDLHVTTQVKLLRVIESNEISPVGSDTTHRVDVRYIAATHKDLEKMVEAKAFRRDLYERLAGNVIPVPPLRERTEDIEEIGRAFVAHCLPKGALPETEARIEAWLSGPEPHRHGWPGNVRELQNALRNLLLGLEPDFKAQLSFEQADRPEVPAAIAEGRATLEDVEQWYVDRALDRHDQNMAAAARDLGVDRTTISRRLKRRKARPGGNP